MTTISLVAILALGCDLAATGTESQCVTPGESTRLIRVEQASMEPTLDPGDVVLAFGIVTSDPVAGDIVAFDPPETWANPVGQPWLKRVVATEFQRVVIADGELHVDGVRVNEPYLAPGTETQAMDVDSWQVPMNHVFVLGDARSHSADSRSFGPLPLDAVFGHVSFRCEPRERRGPIE